MGFNLWIEVLHFFLVQNPARGISDSFKYYTYMRNNGIKNGCKSWIEEGYCHLSSNRATDPANYWTELLARTHMKKSDECHSIEIQMLLNKFL